MNRSTTSVASGKKPSSTSRTPTDDTVDIKINNDKYRKETEKTPEPSQIVGEQNSNDATVAVRDPNTTDKMTDSPNSESQQPVAGYLDADRVSTVGLLKWQPTVVKVFVCSTGCGSWFINYYYRLAITTAS